MLVCQKNSKWVIVITLLLGVTHNLYAALVSMRGGEYIVKDISSAEEIHSETLHIVFQFKTIDPSSLLLFSANLVYGDYISLELIGGKLRYKGRLGDEDNEQLLVVGDKLLNDYNWHVVDIKLNKQTVNIELDQKLYTKTFNGIFEVFDLDGKIYLGGIDPNFDVPSYGITKRKYSGCIKNFFFNDDDFLYKTKYSKPRYSGVGDLLWNQCEVIDYQPIMFNSPQEHALLPTFQEHSLSLTFKFRTLIGLGLMFSKISRAVSASLYLKDAKLFLNVRIGDGNGPIIMTKGENLDDGFWHRVEILIDKKKITLKLDDHSELAHHSPFSHLVAFHRGNATLGGGEEQIMYGFVGCMYNIWVDNTQIDYKKLSAVYSAGVLKKCELNDRCLFSPCRNGGKCSQDHKAFKCNCMNTMYSGKTCEESAFQPSCQEYKDLGLSEDAYCTIDPDGDENKIKPFRVLCNMTRDTKKAFTVFQHHLNKGGISVAKGVVAQDNYHHTLDYEVSIETFDYLLKHATHCQQYVEFKCKNAFLMKSPRGPPDTEWVGRQGNSEHYWGGAEPDSGSCACRYDQSCSHPYRYCNCDIGDDVWRSDSGYLKEIDRLPVVGLTFKLSANQSFFSVGNLECQFNSTTIPQNLSKFRALKACTPVNQRPTTRPTVTNPSIKQKERILNWEKKGGFNFGKVPTKNSGWGKPFVPKVNVNVTVELPKILEKEQSKPEEGLKFTLSVYAVIVIAVATVIVVIIIAIVIIAKRCQRSRENGRQNDSDLNDGYDREEVNEMCTFFGSYSRSNNSNRPVIEVHRHSIHCDTLDELPPAYREYAAHHDYANQPITTHIDLSYKPHKKGFGLFC